MGQARHVSVLLLCFALPAAPAWPQPQADQETWGMFEYFRLDPVSGARQPLDWTRAKTKQAGPSFWCYLPGVAASVEFPYGEELVFAAPVEAKIDELRSPSVKLERLTLKDGQRYATSSYVPLDVTDTGQQVQIVSPQDKKKKRPLSARVYRYRPKERLAPGEYSLGYRGMIMEHLGCNVFMSAFRITPGAPAAQRSVPTPQPTAPASPTQRAALPTDMRELREVAERGDKFAQYQLGYSYGMGTGVPQDYELAAVWLRKAAAQGLADAQYFLAIMHRDGLGMSIDDGEAVRQFRQAAEQGHSAAQVYLAEYHTQGKGVSKDLVEAHKWLNLAAARLTGEAQKQAAAFRDQVAGQLTPAEVTEAQRRAREWMEGFESRRR